MLTPIDCIKRFHRTEPEPFLNYIKIMVPKNRWHSYIKAFMLVKNLKNWKEGFDLYMSGGGVPAEPHYVLYELCVIHAVLTDPDLIVEFAIKYKSGDMTMMLGTLEERQILEPKHLIRYDISVQSTRKNQHVY